MGERVAATAASDIKILFFIVCLLENNKPLSASVVPFLGDSV
jgi:hypothetical protein